MNWVTLLVAIGLGVLWVISLLTGGAEAWFTWLVFVAAVVLIVTALVGLGYTRRHVGKPI